MIFRTAALLLATLCLVASQDSNSTSRPKYVRKKTSLFPRMDAHFVVTERAVKTTLMIASNRHHPLLPSVEARNRLLYGAKNAKRGETQNRTAPESTDAPAPPDSPALSPDTPASPESPASPATPAAPAVTPSAKTETTPKMNPETEKPRTGGLRPRAPAGAKPGSSHARGPTVKEAKAPIRAPSTETVGPATKEEGTRIKLSVKEAYKLAGEMESRGSA